MSLLKPLIFSKITFLDKLNSLHLQIKRHYKLKKTLIKLADIFDVSLDELVGRDF